MAWPHSQDYNEAIQDPGSCFGDAELKQGEVVTNELGLPAPCSGNFADVYAVDCPATKSKWAVKCFTREIAGLKERYREISTYLKQTPLPFMVDFTYLEQGIRVRGQWYPILKMRWVEGFALNTFIKNNLDKPPVLDVLSQIWVKMAARLREGQMAHCDLQHGNVLLVPGSKAASLVAAVVAVVMIVGGIMFISGNKTEKTKDTPKVAAKEPEDIQVTKKTTPSPPEKQPPFKMEFKPKPEPSKPEPAKTEAVKTEGPDATKGGPAVAAATPTDGSPMKLATVQEFAWGSGERGSSEQRMIHKEKGFAFLSSMGGKFEGGGEKVGVNLKADGFWYLSGTAAQPIGARAISIQTPQPMFTAAVKEYEWGPGSSPVKLIAANDGICILSDVCGKFLGYGESLGVTVKDDGYWYLTGSAASPVAAKAISLPFSKGVQARVKEYTWIAGQNSVKMIKKDDGFCFLSTVSGAFRGGGEEVKVHLAADNYWYLSGRSAQAALSAKAMSVEFTSDNATAVVSTAPKPTPTSAPKPSVTPYARWTFDEDARDCVGTMHGKLMGEALIVNGRLRCNGKNSYVQAPLTKAIKEKSLEAWVSLATLDQHCIILNIGDQSGTWDGIVYGEEAKKLRHGQSR